ncbi:putative bifunctional diguanylate cyclase/phosphodiesterase [Vibrio palustris]|uniref:Cyclic di-GMP phosphodiesterase Gmr n=1 Tax=Vibrio palustris TaxID=1918946 RepID=A0A1R4B2A1_9VIBR|nr:EAL domain-containing protein [Vibrio palustris]SJL83038.1 Cyclic di-GMP phosphodiesterase Gmr [Vibrio palustris]
MNHLLNQATTLRQQLSSIVSAIPFGVLVISDDQEIEIINANALAFLGIQNKLPADFIDHKYDYALATIPIVLDKYEKLILTGKRDTFSLPSRDQLNERQLFITCQKMLQGTLFVIEDRTQETILLHDTSHDYLTQLLNRQCFEAYLKNELESYDIDEQSVLVFIDLDRFKLVNDMAGHEIGDEILKRVTTAIISSVQDTDEVARIGGDEFALLIKNCRLNRAKDIVNVILRKVENINLVHSGKVLNVSLSAGIAPVDSGVYANVSQIMNAVDSACRLAKADNEERIHITDSFDREYTNYLQDTSLLNIINNAIAESEFYLVGQEISSLDCHSDYKHYEILLRLKASDNSNIPPNLFIPVAERSRIMSKIDRWVITEAFSMVVDNMNISINLSGQSLSDMTLATFIMELADRYRVNPGNITFEITETAAIENIEKTQLFIQTLKKDGYKFSLDDFGTGLSSYQYLKSLPFDYIKIDGMFVKDIANDDFSHAMVSSINDFAHTIGLHTIAEFASSQEIVKHLNNMGVDYAQGFYIHEPQLLSEIVALALNESTYQT